MKRHPPIGLPELRQLHLADNSGSDKAALVAQLLKEVAERNRNGHLQSFYSIRSVAEHFGIPAATVSRIYRRLNSERLLRTLWGSKTLLEPRDTGGRLSVGLPVNVSRFRASITYREAIRVLQAEMWNCGVDEHLLFFEIEDSEIIDLCTRNHRPVFETIAWLLPDVRYRNTLLRLRDLGFRVLVLVNDMIPGLPDCIRISQHFSIRMIIRKYVCSDLQCRSI